MELSARSYLTAGVAALGATAIALSPVQPLPGNPATAPQRAASTLAVDLAAAIDPITPWLTTIRTSLQNLVALPTLYFQQPLPILTTIARNQLTYLKELPDIGLIASQMAGNVKIFFTGPYQAAPELISDALVTSIAGFPISQQTVYGFLLTDAPDQVDPYIEFAASPVSGELLGFAGPFVSPLIQLTESFTAIGAYVKSGDVAGALNELINIPANVTNAFLNGGKYLDLTGIVPKLGIALPPQVSKIGFNMGGLLNVAPRAYEPPTLPGSDVHPYGGGVAFDSIAVELQQEAVGLRDPGGSTATVSDPGWPTGAIAPVIGLGQALADEMLVSNQELVSGAPAATKAAAQAVPEATGDAAAVKKARPATPRPGALFKRGRAAAGSGAATRAPSRAASPVTSPGRAAAARSAG